jgi:hypothetical protein
LQAVNADKELTEGYSNFTKTQIKNLVKYCDVAISEMNSYIAVKRSQQQPRRRKAQPPERIAAKVQYLREDKALELQSLPPAKLVGCKEAWLYDTGKRKLIYLVADSHTATLTVKGTTVLGFDTTKSVSKTVRKPEAQLAEFMKLGKPASRKYVEDMKTVGIEPSGRLNAETLILKVN